MSKFYCVYEHVFPSGKKYIGITCDVKKRWKNGRGYESQTKISNAINKYGWDNIKHNIIVDGLSKEQAERLEEYLIAEFDTINNGYNSTIGGQNIKSSYLNEHILYFIRESKELDYLYQERQSPDDIVSVFENGFHNKTQAELFNWIDETIEADFPSYRNYLSNAFIDGKQRRCEAYWYYARQILTILVSGDYYNKEGIKPFEQYIYDYYFGE